MFGNIEKKPPSEIDDFEDICFQDEVEIICNFLRWDSFPKRSTENFKRMLEKRAQNFFVDDYIPATDDIDASHVLPWRLFFTGRSASSGDERMEEPPKFELAGGQIEGVKRIVIPHPRQQQNVLSKVHEGKEGVHLHGGKMLEKTVSMYYWRDMRTSISDFMKNCETCNLQDVGTYTHPGISAGTGLETSGSSHESSREHAEANAVNLGDDDDDDDNDIEVLESSKLSNEIPYHEEIDQVYNYLKLGKYPPNSTVNQKRGIRRKAEQYMLGEDHADDQTNGVSSKKLYHVKNTKSDAGLETVHSVYMRLVVTSAEEQQNILQVAHIGPSGQHCGRDKMKQSISHLYFWKGLSQSIMSFLQSCSKCQLMRAEAKRKSLDLTTTYSEAIKKKSLDLPATYSEAKKKSLDHPEIHSVAKRKSLDLPATYSEAKKKLLDHPEIHSVAKRKSLALPATYSEAKKKLLDHPEIHSVAKRKSLDLPATYSEPKKKLLDHPEIHSVDKRKSVDHPRTRSEAKRKLLDHPTTRSKAKMKSNQPIIKLDFKKTKKQAPKEDGLVPAPAKQEIPPLPRELTNLPKGLSHLTGLDAEMEALILYHYLKWHEYPPDCTVGFKGILRKKARSFCLQENEGDGGENWSLFYKGDFKRIARDIGQVAESEENTGATVGIECAESEQMEVSDDNDRPMDSPESNEPEETISDTMLSKRPVVIGNESLFVDRTENRLYVFRKADKEKIIQYVHLKGGKNEKHAPYTRIVCIISHHFYWRGIKDDIMAIIKNCRCQRNSSANMVKDNNVVVNSTEDVLEENLSSHQLPQHMQTYLENAMRMETEYEVEEISGDFEQVERPCNPNEKFLRVLDRRISQRRERLALNRFPIKPKKVTVKMKTHTAKKEKPPLPAEFTRLPEGLSHIRGLDTELEGLVLSLYLKRHEYPPGCTETFKRIVRKKAQFFSVYEYEGNKGENWCLFYNGEGRGKWSLPRDPDQVVETKENTGDTQAERADSVKGLMETTEPEETEELGEVVQVPETGGRRVTEESDTLLPKGPVMFRNEMPIALRTHKLYVFRRADKDTILKYMHLKGGKDGKHASRDTITNMVIPHFYWRGLREDILDLIMNCKQCQMRRKGELDAVYLQDSNNKSAEEDLTSHQLPEYMQTYLEDAMKIDGWLETEDLPNKGTIVHSNESKEDLQRVHRLAQDRSTTGDLSSFRSHMCDSCPRGFRDWDSLRRHKRSKHRKRSSVECPVCGKKTSELLVHMRTHTKEKPLECDICNRRFAYRSGLSVHKRKHSGYKPFRCSDCPMQFISHSDLKAHFRSCHEGRGDYQCDVCEKVFATQFRLDKHHQRTHSNESFVCEECGKILASAFTLKYHKLIHTGENLILCEMCGKGFKKKCDLKKHIDHHLGIKNHQCHLCQQRFCLKGDLQDHLRVHQGASSYECDICQKKFKNKRSLARCKRKHGSRAAPAAVFQCNTCEDVLATFEDFKQHTAAHHLLEGAQHVQHEVEIQ